MSTATTDPGNDPTQRAQAMASLSAIIQKQAELRAKRPRRRHISAATHESRDALYLHTWRNHVERVGNDHYPQEAKDKELFGELRMLVALNTDGSVNNIEIRQSSGHHVLDAAAIQIVKLASPFAPFTEEMSKDTDILEIIRTWQFDSDHHLKSKG